MITQWSSFVIDLSAKLSIKNAPLRWSIWSDNPEKTTAGPFDTPRFLTHLQSEEADIRVVQVVMRNPVAASDQNQYLMNIGLSRASKYLVFSISTSSLKMLSSTELFIKSLVVLHVPDYGIGYTAGDATTASYYALGIASASALPSSDADWDELEHLSRWGHTGMPNEVYRSGLFRDVYPWNILADIHLEQKVSGLPLQEWIARDQLHGVLNRLTKNNVLWLVDRANIPMIRQVLLQEGLLFR